MTKSPARKLVLPKHLRAVDRTTLSWRQLRLVLASVALRDRILLTLDMWDARTPTVRQTAYRGELRDFGQDPEIAEDSASSRRAGERTVAMEAGVPGSLAGSIHLSECAQAQWGKEERLHPHGQLPREC